jgi:uncharacterized protein YndB with AHSA1/START domain
MSFMDREAMTGREETQSSGEAPGRTTRAVIDRSAGTITAAVDVATPPERVYRMLVTAETERWWGSPETYAMREWAAELRPGGSWRVLVCFADGRRLPASGHFLQFDPPEKVVQTRTYELDHPTLGVSPIANAVTLAAAHGSRSSTRASPASRRRRSSTPSAGSGS